jgi:hypothetical protein
MHNLYKRMAQKAGNRASKRMNRIQKKVFMLYYGDIFGASAKFNRRKRSIYKR